MEIDNKNNSIEALRVEPSPSKGDQDHEYGLTSAHTTDHDSWRQVGLMLVTSFNCGYILSFSNLMLVPLGWTWGIVCLFVVGIFTWQDFTSSMAKDLLDTEISWALFLEINSEFSNSPLRLQYFIIITGASYFIFSFLVPTMSAMRKWLGISTVLTFSYSLILLVILIKDGKSIKNRDYEIRGSNIGKVFNGFGAVSAIIVCNTSDILLEIQSTLRKPAVQNMRKAFYLQYSIVLAVYYGVSMVGYWAYGSAVSEYLPKELSGPKWVKVMINSGAFVQSVISQHHQFMKLLIPSSLISIKACIENIKCLFYLRAVLFTGNTMVTAALPFMGDFVNLLGSFTLLPLTFVFPSMIFLKVKGKTARLEKKVWHWINIVLFSLLGVATTISAVRLIVNNVRQYHFFADT